jgi:hypothetical protein
MAVGCSPAPPVIATTRRANACLNSITAGSDDLVFVVTLATSFVPQKSSYLQSPVSSLQSPGNHRRAQNRKPKQDQAKNRQDQESVAELCRLVLRSRTKGFRLMKKFSSTGAALWCFATLPVSGIAQDGGTGRQRPRRRSSQVHRNVSRDQFVFTLCSMRRSQCAQAGDRLDSSPGAIGMAHPSARSGADRDRWRWLGSTVGRPGAGDAQGRCRLDSTRRKALARCDANQLRDPSCVSRANRRSSGELAGKGYGRTVPDREVRKAAL